MKYSKEGNEVQIMDSEEKHLIRPSNINYKKEIFASEPCFTIMLLLYLNNRIGFTELYKLAIYLLQKFTFVSLISNFYMP